MLLHLVESELPSAGYGHLMMESRLAWFDRRGILPLVLLLAPTALLAQRCPDANPLTPAAPPIATVRYLADDALEGRLAGSPGERCAGDYIAAQFRLIGLEKGGTENSYYQPFPLASALNPHAPAGTGRNVIGFLRGSDPRLRDEWVIVGAHYDHLGHGEFGSTAPGAIHNGADDNASGVAALLDVAERLTRERPARSVAFLAFSGEESGILGSTHFTNQPTLDLNRVRAMLNMDMVGRLGTGTLIIYGTGTAKEWDTIVREATAAERVEFRAQPEGYGPSDHTAFYTKDIPVLHFFTNAHADYHKPSDDWARIDSAGLERVARVVSRVARAVAGSGAPITLVQGAGRPPAAGGTSGYVTYLGTVPDFQPVPYGVKLSGVTPGSPADQAGIRAGDVIIRFDKEEVGTLEAMTVALRKREPGDSVRITVLRDGKEVVLTAVLGRRG
jgi:peptidase M28-like protein/PDZ domain-containing protein